MFPCAVDPQLYCYCLLLTFTLLHPATRIGYHQAANNRYPAPAPAPAPASAEESDILESQASVATIHQPQAVEFCFPLGRAEARQQPATALPGAVRSAGVWRWCRWCRWRGLGV